MSNRIRWITVTAVGIALFVVLSLVLRIPVFGRFYLCLGYLVMAIYCYYAGVFSGTVVGTVGILLYCLITSSVGGMVGWALGNAVIGLSVGFAAKLLRGVKHEAVRQIVLIAVGIVATAIGMLLVKSIYESLVSGLPFGVRVAANTAGFIADAFVLSIGFPLALAFRRVFPKLLQQPQASK